MSSNNYKDPHNVDTDDCVGNWQMGDIRGVHTVVPPPPTTNDASNLSAVSFSSSIMEETATTGSLSKSSIACHI